MNTSVLSINVEFKGKLYKNVECVPLQNGHVFAQIESDIYECKKCTRCGKWHTVDNYHCNNRAKDSLSVWCKECTSRYKKDYYREKKEGKSVEDITEQIEALEPSQEVADKDLNIIIREFEQKLGEYYNSTFRAENEDWIEEAARLEQENQVLRDKIEELRKEIAKPIDISKVPERDIVQYLNTHKIPPRILIDAITPLAPNLEITITDITSGATRTIRDKKSVNKAA